MFNLISTIIAVALTAALAAAEVTYVGSAFTSASPKAMAAQIIMNMSQIDAAWTLWGTTQSTTAAFPTMVSGTNLATDLLGIAAQPNTQYLASIPTPPNTATVWGGVANSNVYLLDRIAGASPETAETGIFLVLDNTSLQTCTEIARSAGQVSATGTLATPGILAAGTLTTNIVGSVSFTTAFTGYKYGCVQYNGAAAGLTIAGVTAVAADLPAAATGPKYIAYFKQ